MVNQIFLTTQFWILFKSWTCSLVLRLDIQCFKYSLSKIFSDILNLNSCCKFLSCCTFYSVRFNSTKQPWICIKKFCRSYFSTEAKWESAATKMGHSVRSEKCIYSHFAIKYSFSGQRARVGQQQRRAMHFFVSILDRTSWEKREWLLVFKIQRILNHSSKLVMESVWFWGQ